MMLAACQAASRVLEHALPSDGPRTIFRLSVMAGILVAVVHLCGTRHEALPAVPRALEALVAAMHQLQVERAGWGVGGWDSGLGWAGCTAGRCKACHTPCITAWGVGCSLERVHSAANALVCVRPLACLQARLPLPHEPDATEWLSTMVEDFLSLPDRCGRWVQGGEGHCDGLPPQLKHTSLLLGPGAPGMATAPACHAPRQTAWGARPSCQGVPCRCCCR